MRISILIIFIHISFALCAQEKSNDNQLALMYYSKGEYQKAASLYETLYYQSHSQIHFDYLTQCYIHLNTVDKAVSLTQEQIKYFPKSFYYPVKLASLYQIQNKYEQANELHNKIIKKALKNEIDCIEAGNAFIEDNQVEKALELFIQARKKYPDNITIYKKVAFIYQKQNSYEKLLQAYFDILENAPYELEYIESQLQLLLYENTNLDLKEKLEVQLLGKIEENPKSVELNQLLLWFYIQEKSFKRAFLLARSIDLKNNEDGEKVFNIGKLALSNSDFTIATDCFSYIISKGSDNTYYMHSLKLLLETSYNKLFIGMYPEKAKIQTLELQYIEVLQQIGKNENTTDVIRNLAHIQAFYLNKFTEAITLLQEVNQIQGISYIEKALCEIELANVYLFSDDIWSANLLYAKVALNYKNNDVGHQARFKQAQIAYYNGQFEYAQALLDILKASTSKLISNDAFELSQLISDNSLLDTTTTALSYFAKADLYTYQNKNEIAFQYLDSIVKLFPGHSLEDDILLRRALVAKNVGDTATMVHNLYEITQRFSYDIYADNAHFMLAEYYDFVAKNSVLAQEHYKSIIVNYSNSYFSSIARKRYRELEKL